MPENPSVSVSPAAADLLTVEQAANYLQLSQSSIRSYIRHGNLKAFRVAGLRKVLIPRDELRRLLEPACDTRIKTVFDSGCGGLSLHKFS